jgi:hypothetical protein
VARGVVSAIAIIPGGERRALWSIVADVPSGAPWTWRFRIAGKDDALALVSPPKSEAPQFADIVHDNIRKAKAGS